MNDSCIHLMAIIEVALSAPWSPKCAIEEVTLNLPGGILLGNFYQNFDNKDLNYESTILLLENNDPNIPIEGTGEKNQPRTLCSNRQSK